MKREYGIKIDKLINCGGIAEKNSLVMQIYADILNRPMEVAESAQTVALGAALIGGFVGMEKKENFESIQKIQNRVCRTKEKKYIPNPQSAETYAKIYRLYDQVHNSFGKQNTQIDLFNIMKNLLEIKKNKK